MPLGSQFGIKKSKSAKNKIVFRRFYSYTFTMGDVSYLSVVCVVAFSRLSRKERLATYSDGGIVLIFDLSSL